MNDQNASAASLANTDRPLRIVIIGLSITSSWGNGHATTYRGLVRELARRGNKTTFLECDKPWYAANRDLPKPPFGETFLYENVADLEARFEQTLREADLLIIGSYVPDGVAVIRFALSVAEGATAFYDIDTPITLTRLAAGDFQYLHPELIPEFDAYLSFTGGPTLGRLREQWKARRAEPLFCSVDPALYRPAEDGPDEPYALGYLGTYSPDRQPGLEALLIEPARRRVEDQFVVAGPQYPATIEWPANVQHLSHLPPGEHRRFYNRQRFTLNLTRADMRLAGYSPSVRLFEAAACQTAIISDWWEGLDELFEVGKEILIACNTDDVLRYLTDTREQDRRAIGEGARRRVLTEHTSAHRAAELEALARELLAPRKTLRKIDPTPQTAHSP